VLRTANSSDALRQIRVRTRRTEQGSAGIHHRFFALEIYGPGVGWEDPVSSDGTAPAAAPAAPKPCGHMIALFCLWETADANALVDQLKTDLLAAANEDAISQVLESLVSNASTARSRSTARTTPGDAESPELKRTQEELEELKKTFNATQGQLKIAQDQNAPLLAKQDQLAQEIARLKKATKDTQAAHKKQIDQLKKDNKEALDELQKQLDEKDAAHREATRKPGGDQQRLEQEKAALQAEIARLQTERDALQVRLDTALETIEKTKQELEETQEMQRTLQVLLDDSEAEKQQIQDQLDQATAKNKELQEQYEAQIAELQQEKETLLTENETQKKQIQKLEVAERIVSAVEALDFEPEAMFKMLEKKVDEMQAEYRVLCDNYLQMVNGYDQLKKLYEQETKKEAPPLPPLPLPEPTPLPLPEPTPLHEHSPSDEGF
jgi:chromosome segregation ATPase